jgi:hypothetical protein
MYFEVLLFPLILISYSTVVNKLVGQYRNHRVPFAEKLRFSRWVDTENW